MTNHTLFVIFRHNSQRSGFKGHEFEKCTDLFDEYVYDGFNHV